MSDRYDRFASPLFERPEAGVLRIVLEVAGLSSAAYECYRFGGLDAAEGLAALREKREPCFCGPASE